MRCFNCGMENVSKAMFCERCGTRLLLPPIEAQPEIHNASQGKIFGIIPRVAVVPIVGLVIGAIAYLFYVIALTRAMNSISDPDFDPSNNIWASDPQSFILLAVVLGIIAAVVFWGGIIRIVLRSY